jgi:type I restriction enzyme R subunit
MNKKSLTERDICTKFVVPALQSAGWDIQSSGPGRVLLHSRPGPRPREESESRKSGSSLTSCCHLNPNAAGAHRSQRQQPQRRQRNAAGTGLRQNLDVPFVFSTNGDGFLFHDRLTTSGLSNRNYRSTSFHHPQIFGSDTVRQKTDQARLFQSMIARLLLRRQWTHAPLLPDHCHQPSRRSHQQRPEASIAGHGHRHGQNIHRISDHLETLEIRQAKRILFLADRNILVDQTMVNDFRPFKGAMAKLSPKSKTIELSDGTEESIDIAIGKKRTINKSYEIYLSLYQAVRHRRHQKTSTSSSHQTSST